MSSSSLAAVALQNLCSVPATKELLSHYDGIPLLLSILHSDNVELLWQVVWCLVLLSSDTETSNEIRITGGIPLLLSLLQYVQYKIHKKWYFHIIRVEAMFEVGI